MDKSLINTNIEQQFTEVVNLIVQHRSKASMAVNKEMLLIAWHVGAYVSKKLKSEEWGSKVISQLSEYIRSQHPEIKGYSRRNIYNMVMFYDEYSTETFTTIVNKYLDAEFVQPMAAQIEVKQYAMSRSMSSTMVAEYKRILIPQEKMQQQLREFCQFFSKEDKS